MDGANKKFIAEKEAWLNKHIIFYNVLNASANPYNDPLAPTNPAGELPVYDFDLRPTGKVSDLSGKGVKAYELKLLAEFLTATKQRKTSSRTNTLRAYFLPWGSNRTYQGRLGNQADFFFTPTLNGCTFASSGGGATPLVSHGNHANAATQKIDQGLINNDLAGIYGAAGPGMILHKAGYKVAPVGTEDYKVTIVRIRRNNAWDFYYQRYQQDQNPAGGLVNMVMDRVVKL